MHSNPHAMKNLVLLLLIFSRINAFAQTIPNGSFENWNSTLYIQANGWDDSNRESLRKGNAITATRVAGSSGYAIQLQTLITQKDTMGAFISTMGDPMAGKGGFPYTQMPSSISGKYKCNTPGNDTALFLVGFKKNGILYHMELFAFHGNINTFTPFTFSLNPGSAPDTIIVAAAASNLISNKGVQNGSTLILDELSFGGSGITQVIPNGGFEDWTNKSYDQILNWHTYDNENIQRRTPGVKGSSAVRIETIRYEDGYVGIGRLFLSTDPYGINGFTGPRGVPYNQMKDTLTGYYLYNSPVADSGLIEVVISGSSFSNSWYFHPKRAFNFTYFELPISAGGNPDTIDVLLSASPLPGSVLIVDELQLKSSPLHTGIKKQNGQANLLAYPVPATDFIYFNAPANTLYHVLSLDGKELLSGKAEGMTDQKIAIQQLQNGVYLLLLEDELGQSAYRRFIKQ